MTASPVRWLRVTRAAPCPICAHADWCMVAPDGGAALCMRESSDRPSTGDAGGWIHRVGSPASHRVHQLPAAPTSKLSSAQCTLIDRQCRADLTPDRIARLSDRLRVSASSLRRLGIGWHHERGAYSFPMRDAADTIIGIRLRHTDGSKRAIAGSRLGIITPIDDGGATVVPEWLLICEGESDAAAAIDLGFLAVGRPGCETCGAILIGYVSRIRPERVAIVADADDPGQRGAHKLARSIASVASISARVLTLSGAKDIREWKRLPDASHHDLLALLEAPASRVL